MNAHVPPFSQTEHLTVPAVFESYARQSPDHPIVIDDHHTVTAGKMLEYCTRVQANLQVLGLGKGDAVGILMGNSWKWIAAVLAVTRGGMIAVPLNTWYKAAELSSATRKAHLRILISEPDLHGHDYSAILQEAGLVDADPSRRYLGTYFWADSDLPVGFDPVVAQSVPAVDIEESDTAMYAFTSGSSAEPKVVVLEHGGLVRNGRAMGVRIGVTHEDRIWFAAPLFFGLGCANVIHVALVSGATLCLQRRFDAAASADFIERTKCTVLYGIGPLIRGLAKLQQAQPRDLSSLTKGVIGVTAEDKRIAIEILGLREARSTYGLTECYGLATMTEPGDDTDVLVRTQGTALATQQIRCADPESGKPIDIGGPERLGEIQLRGIVTPGYLDNDDANAASFTADGWFRTGDLGWLDSYGRLHFAGRLKEVVKINGITISPAEVEDFVAQHPDVEDAYAFGWTNAVGDEQLCCAVVLSTRKEASDEQVAATLTHWLRQRISSYKVPSSFVFLDAEKVPTTATGKISKRLIGEQFIEPQIQKAKSCAK
ncbi:class I adenylate-forming enzyme family protein [Rhodococcus ruber]|nr:class I adenylate-forming enzyme family protein [Rhodococcus ruber]